MRPRQTIGGIGIGFSIDMWNAIAVTNDFYIFGINLCMYNSQSQRKENYKTISHAFKIVHSCKIFKFFDHQNGW